MSALLLVATGVVWLVVTELGWFREADRPGARGRGGARGRQVPVIDGTHGWLGYLLTSAAVVVGVAIYLARQSWPYLALAVVGVTLVVPEAISDWTEGSLGVVGGVLVTGVTLLVASFAGYRLRAERSPERPAHGSGTAAMICAMAYALGQGTGPLAGVKVVEIASIGPGPHACMILADLGADVIRVERPGGQTLTGGPTDLLTRGRPNVALDLKRPEAIATVLDLVEGADVLVEGMRPGTTERLGLGPDVCLERNPRLVYGRMTGWGQDGPLASSRRARHELHRDHRRPLRDGAGQGAGRTSRRTWSATSVAARRTS